MKKYILSLLFLPLIAFAQLTPITFLPQGGIGVSSCPVNQIPVSVGDNLTLPCTDILNITTITATTGNFTTLNFGTATGSLGLGAGDAVLGGTLEVQGAGDSSFVGSVGIGTATPIATANLHVTGGDIAVGNADFVKLLNSSQLDDGVGFRRTSANNFEITYTGNNMIIKAAGNQDINIRNSAGATYYDFEMLTGETSFNEQGVDIDLRVEGDTNPNLFFVDAGTDRVGIGTSAPSSVLHTKATDVGFGTGGIRLEQSADATSWDLMPAFNNLFFGREGSVKLEINSVGDLKMQDGAFVGIASSPRIAFDSTNSFIEMLGGNVGIGTAAPGSILELAVNDPVIIFNDTAGGTQIDFTIGVSTAARFELVDTTNSRTLFSYISTGTGDSVWNTDSGNTPVHVSRVGATNQTGKFFTDDSFLHIQAIQDETNGGGIKFKTDSTADNIISGFFFNDLNDSTLMKITADGNVGIGTITPLRKLEVNSGVDNGAVRLISTDAAVVMELLDNTGTTSAPPYVGATGDTVYLGRAGTNPLNVNTTTNRVGIGTASPNNPLTVSGNANVTGRLSIGATSATNKFEVHGCISGFTDMRIGCIQTAEEGSGTPNAASDDCYDTYGGRLPTGEELFLGAKNNALTSETDDKELTGDQWEDEGETGSSVVACGKTDSTNIAASRGVENQVCTTGSIAYRCFMPYGSHK